MEPQTDAEVIASSLARPVEFGAIFDRHAPVVLRFLVRRVGPDTGASLLGELFRVAFERRHSFDLARASARPWLYGIATNLLLHRTRSYARETRAIREIESHALVALPSRDSEVDLVEAIDARLLLPQVAMALHRLPEGEREALVLYAWEEQSYDETAEAMEVPVGTVRSRIHRARGRLRELIGAGGKDRDEPPDFPAAPEGRG